MIVAGVMSGTSADGIDVALVRLRDHSDLRLRRASSAASPRGKARLRQSATPPFELIGHAEFPYPKQVRAAVLEAMNAQQASVADLARLNFLLGELYADAVLATQRRFRVKAELIGCHGQTLYHQGVARLFLGRKVAATWQTGEGAVIAARVGAPVVSDFRPADMAAGGKGAPLVPFLDYALYRDPRVGRIAQNIGGIANLTAIPAGAAPGQVVAFDTGPGNMVIDAVTEKLCGRAYDRDGEMAASGMVLAGVCETLLRGKFFQQKPPKTAGREEFGRAFVKDFLRSCGRAGKSDVIATATALTARSIALAVQRFVLQSGPSPPGNTSRLSMPLDGAPSEGMSLGAMPSAGIPSDRMPLGRKLSDRMPLGASRLAGRPVGGELLAAELLAAKLLGGAALQRCDKGPFFDRGLQPALPGNFREVIVSGGGARNPTLLAMLANELSQLGLALRLSAEFGLPSQAKEAVAFALLAHETWQRRPSNVASATGATRAAVLGKISYPWS
jgi:anhydro-N-acetylmuramic acid kinase